MYEFGECGTDNVWNFPPGDRGWVLLLALLWRNEGSGEPWRGVGAWRIIGELGMLNGSFWEIRPMIWVKFSSNILVKSMVV